ncbi:hypothetical protein [Engelhardtia mirabilis]|uniref:Tetratricopeptide repeat protein n=1 Tax=Engelhardtia mirabilis TaxID=2528011 RepID=A0A518BFR9_9BACT|nr:hypothetical protein Pla133_08960 [Planctomycetes bacterium Pla133]QDV00156.1 hypothetical protein Pla86_08950 [Planctomycetes bacterium Pla86]
MRSLRLFAACSLIALVSCGGAATPTDLHNQGLDQASAGDFDAAIASYNDALKSADGDLALTIRLDLANALTHTDASAATDVFMAMVEEHGDELTERDFMGIGRQLKDAKAYSEASTVVDAGIKHFGESESPKLVELMELIKRDVLASGDAAGMAALEGLGYIGE